MKTIIASPTGRVVDDRPLWTRIRRWAVSMTERELRSGRLADHGARLPLVLLGGRVVFTKDTVAMRTPYGTLAIKHDGLKVKQAFLTYPCPDGLGVFHIHTWLYGAPDEVVKFVEHRAVA